MGSSNKKKSNNNNMEHRTGKNANQNKPYNVRHMKNQKKLMECLWVR